MAGKNERITGKIQENNINQISTASETTKQEQRGWECMRNMTE